MIRAQEDAQTGSDQVTGPLCAPGGSSFRGWDAKRQLARSPGGGATERPTDRGAEVSEAEQLRVGSGSSAGLPWELPYGSSRPRCDCFSVASPPFFPEPFGAIGPSASIGGRISGCELPCRSSRAGYFTDGRSRPGGRRPLALYPGRIATCQ